MIALPSHDLASASATEAAETARDERVIRPASRQVAAIEFVGGGLCSGILVRGVGFLA